LTATGKRRSNRKKEANVRKWGRKKPKDNKKKKSKSTLKSNSVEKEETSTCEQLIAPIRRKEGEIWRSQGNQNIVDHLQEEPQGKHVNKKTM